MNTDTTTTTDELPIPHGAFTTPQPKIDLSGCKPGAIVESIHGITGFLESINESTSPEKYRFVWSNGVVTFHMVAGEHIYGSYSIKSILPDPRDEEIARLNAEIKRRDSLSWYSKYHAANAKVQDFEMEYEISERHIGTLETKVEELALETGRLASNNTKLKSEASEWVKTCDFKDEQIAQLTKELSELDAQSEREHKRYMEENEQWAMAAISAGDAHNTEMARVLTALRKELMDGTIDTTLLVQLNLQGRFRWNGEAFEGIDQKAEPEQVGEPCKYCGVIGNHLRWCKNTDPLDAPVTLRELCKHLDSYCEPTDEEDVVTLPFTNLVRHIVERSAK